MNLGLSSIAAHGTTNGSTWTWNVDGRAEIEVVFGEVTVVNLGLAALADDFPIRALPLPVRFQMALLHLLATGQAADSEVKAALGGVFASDGHFASFCAALDQRVAAVYGEMILHFAALDLSFAAIIALGALHDEIVQDVGQDFASR